MISFFVRDEFSTETCMLLLSPANFSNMSGHMTKLSQKEKEKHLPVWLFCETFLGFAAFSLNLGLND